MLFRSIGGQLLHGLGEIVLLGRSESRVVEPSCSKESSTQEDRGKVGGSGRCGGGGVGADLRRLRSGSRLGAGLGELLVGLKGHVQLHGEKEERAALLEEVKGGERGGRWTLRSTN